MSQLMHSGEDVAQRGKAYYEALRSQVEAADNIGKIIAIEINTGDYTIGDDLLETSLRLKAKYPDGEMWAERIGFNAVYAVGGTLLRTAA
jgi:predicted solute-binding protein